MQTPNEKEIAEIKDYLEQNNLFKNEVLVAGILMDAYIQNDVKKITFFDQFGKSLRNKIMNYNAYVHNLKFGFEQIKMNSYDWLEKPPFKIEVIPFKTKYCLAWINEIRLAEGANGKWTYGYSFVFGTSGESVMPHSFGEIFDSREKALQHAMNFMRTKFQKAQRKVNDPSNFKQKLIAGVMELLDKMDRRQQQLSLF